MIFVTVGMGPAPFDRLLRAVDRLPRDEEIVVQYGTSDVRPEGATCVSYLDYEAFVDHVRRARVVVASAGVGATMTALANGKKPVIVPRRSQYGEWLEDHQYEFAKRVADSGYVVVVEDPEELPDVVRSDMEFDVPPLGAGGGLVRDVREYLHAAVRGDGS